MLHAESRCDPVTLLAWLREEERDPLYGEPAAEAVARLQVAGGFATSSAITTCVQLILDRAAQRRMIQVFTQATGDAFNGTPPTAVAARVAAVLAGVTERLRPAPTGRFGLGLGEFLLGVDAEPESYIDGLLSDDGGGWIGGEEKLGKSFFAGDEALCLALGFPVGGRFRVPRRRRVFFLEEEDSPRRMRRRLKALLRGHDLDPDDRDVQAELNAWFHLEVWRGFKFEKPEMVSRLEAAIAAFEPAVVYIDVLRKVTLSDLNKQLEMARLLETLDDLRRRYGVLFRVLHHYRKAQGFRVSRGSGEIAGSLVLGAWAENSLFFEPMGRKATDGVKVSIQMKDGAPEPPFLLTLQGEGPRHAPTRMVLTAQELSEKNAGEQLQDLVLQALAAVPVQPAVVGLAGVSVKALATAVKKSEPTLRRQLRKLADEGLIEVVGQAGKKLDLYAVVTR